MTAAAARAPARRTTYVPPQHGAWAFLVLPLTLGAIVAPWSWLLAVLASAWIAAYPWSYAALGLASATASARVRARARFARPLLAWSAVATPPAIILLVARPWLLWVAAGYLLLFAVNLWYARRGGERSLANDAVLVVECTAMVPVTWAVAVGDTGVGPPSLAAAPTPLWVLTGVCALVLAGSTLHVKSLIRKRHDPRFTRAARVYALVSAVAAIGLAVRLGLPGGLWLLPGFAALTVRAMVARPTRPVRIGLVELACFVLVAAGAASAVSS